MRLSRSDRYIAFSFSKIISKWILRFMHSVDLWLAVSSGHKCTCLESAGSNRYIHNCEICKKYFYPLFEAMGSHLQFIIAWLFDVYPVGIYIFYRERRVEFYIVGTDRLCLIASTACSAGQSNIFPFELKNVGLDTNCHLIIWTIPRGLGLTMVIVWNLKHDILIIESSYNTIYFRTFKSFQ